MGARQSKRSVDITTTPKKGDEELATVGEEKIEKLADADVKAVVTNGTAAHTDIEFADQDEESKEADSEVKKNGVHESSEGEKSPEKESTPVPAAGDQPKTEEVVATETTEKTPENGEKVTETPDPKKQKEKKKKKWSLRSISFSKKDKSKPNKDKDKTNGEVEQLNEEKTEEAVTSPTSEETPKVDDSKVDEAAAPVTNGDATKEELSVPETVKEEDAAEKTKEEQVKSEIVDNTSTKLEPETKTEECAASPVVEKSTKIEETAPVVVEETKEVRKEEVPPPLPSSNPPSQVTVFAESTKDTLLSVDNDKPESPVQESNVPIETEPVILPTVVESEPIVASPEPPIVDLKESEKSVESEVSTVEINEPVIIGASETNSELSNVTEQDSSNHLVQLDSGDAESRQIESEAISLDTEHSASSIPLVEEKIPSSSTAGDGLSAVESNASEESGAISPRRSVDLSIITEVESQESKISETVVAEVTLQKDTDSLPDISTESLPSLPEPTDSMLEPMSLPPLDSVPEPLIDDEIPNSPPKFESSTNPPEPEPEIVLTNGNATNGHESSSPTNDVHDDSPTANLANTLDGPLKQIISPEPISAQTCEDSQAVGGDAPAESVDAPSATE